MVAEATNIYIGEDCMFAAGVTIRTSDQHPIYRQSRHINKAADITIKNHVWLGAKSVIMKGVEVGAGSIVGYGSIVTKKIPDNSVAVGNPAVAIKDDITWKRTFNE